MIVLVTVVMVMAAAPAAGAVLVMMSMVMVMMVVIMLVVMGMSVPMVMMLVAVGVSVAMALAVAMSMTMMMVVPMVVIAHRSALLGFERALDRGRRAALPAHQLGDGRVVLDVKGVRRDLRQSMAAAEVPSQAREAQGILGPYFQQGLGRRLHLNELTVLQPQGIAVVDGGFHVEIEQDLCPALGLQHAMAAVAGFVVEADRIDDAVGLHGGLADDRGDSGHGLSR